LLLERLAGWLGGVPGYGADAELLREDWVCEHGADDGATLVSGCAEDSEKFAHGD